MMIRYCSVTRPLSYRATRTTSKVSHCPGPIPRSRTNLNFGKHIYEFLPSPVCDWLVPLPASAARFSHTKQDLIVWSKFFRTFN